MPRLKLQNLAPALRQHWIKSLSVAAAAAMLTLVGLKYLPPQYASEAKLLVTVGGGNAEELPDLLAREGNAFVQELASPAHLARVAESLGLKHANALQVLRESLTIDAAKDSAEIRIRATADHPDIAKQIVAMLAETCLPEHWSKVVSPAPPASLAADSSAGERETLEKARNSAAIRLREAQGPAGETSLAGRRQLIEEQLAAIEGQLLRELSKHEAEERRLESQLTPAHPQRVALRETIEVLAQQISESGGPLSENSIPGEVGLLCNRRRELRGELAALDQHERLIAQAKEDVETAQSRLNACAERPVMVRGGDQPRGEKSIQLTLVQPASPARQTGGIQPQFLITCGVLAGLLGGIGAALWCFEADPLLLTRSDIERQLELVVTGPIPIEVGPLDVAV
jgi:capsular polysaccharide biosynthesis protein